MSGKDEPKSKGIMVGVGNAMVGAFELGFDVETDGTKYAFEGASEVFEV